MHTTILGIAALAASVIALNCDVADPALNSKCPTTDICVHPPLDALTMVDLGGRCVTKPLAFPDTTNKCILDSTPDTVCRGFQLCLGNQGALEQVYNCNGVFNRDKTVAFKPNPMPIGSNCGDGVSSDVCDSSICAWPYDSSHATCIKKPTVLPTSNTTCVVNDFCGTENQGTLCQKYEESGAFLETIYYCQPRPTLVTVPDAPSAVSSGVATATEVLATAGKAVAATVATTTKSAAEKALLGGVVVTLSIMFAA